MFSSAKSKLIRTLVPSTLLGLLFAVLSVTVKFLGRLSLIRALVLVYGVLTVLLLSFTILTFLRRARSPDATTKAFKEIADVLKLRSSGLNRLSTVFRAFAQFLVWPAAIVHRLANAGDHSLATQYFGLPEDLFLSASDVAISLFAMSVAILVAVMGSPSLLAVCILLVACVVHVTARHLGYVTSPVSLTEKFRRSPGDVFLRLTIVAFADLTTLATAYTLWAKPQAHFGLGVLFTGATELLTFKGSLAILVGSGLPIRQRALTFNMMLYYLAVVRVLWPLKELHRQDGDLVCIAETRVAAGEYRNALRWLQAVQQPDKITNRVFAICYLALGDTAKAISRAERSAPAGECQSDFGFLNLFNAVPLLPEPANITPTSSSMRTAIRTMARNQWHRTLLEIAASAKITDAVSWLGYVTYSLYEPLPGVMRDDDLKKLIERSRFPLSRYFANYEEIEMKYDFMRRVDEEGLPLRGMDKERKLVRDSIIDLRSGILAHRPTALADRVLRFGLLVAVSALREQPSPREQKVISRNLQAIRRMILDTNNDTARLVTIQVLGCLAALLAEKIEESNRFLELTREVGGVLESDEAWIIQTLIPAMFVQSRRLREPASVQRSHRQD